MTAARTQPRPIVVAVLAVALSATVFGLLLGGGETYTVHARFLDAGQLIKGARVEAAGRKVGTISEISLTRDGQVDATLAIDDDHVAPLHEGTRADIRAVGLAGIANRFVSLSPGPVDRPALSDGAVLGTEQTSGIVNIDALLDSFGPEARANMRALIADSAGIYAGSGAASFNTMLVKLDPALRELNGMWGELAQEHGALSRLVDTAGKSASAIASRRQDLTAAVQHTAKTFRAVASERHALADLLDRAPGVLHQAQGTLARTGAAVSALRPALREIRPVAGPLRDYLSRVSTLLPQARPIVAELRGQLPALRATLAGLPSLARPAVPALLSTGESMKALRPIFGGLRVYGSDMVLGLLNGIAGVAMGPYDGNGHYAKGNFVQNVQTLPAGRLAALLNQTDLVPGILKARIKDTRRCPGGNVPPAPDGSNPWIQDKSICDPAHNQPASVNQP